ncbi:MAG: LacI family transcriptional regulator [Pseudomonadota bacterium]
MNAKAGRPTLKTISDLTGLAVPTVSRALSGAQDIGAATRTRVQEVAKEIGYVPNRAGVRLRTGRSYVVSLVLSTEADVMNLTAKLINSVAAGLRGTRYTLTITPVFPDEDPLVPIRNIVETRAADAIILNQTLPEDPRIIYLMEQGFPFATHGRTNYASQHDYYDFDNRALGRIAVKRLTARGRSKFLLLAPPRNQFYGMEVIAGAQAEADMAGVSLKLVEGATSDSPAAEIEEAVTPLLERSGYGADAIISGSSASCMACVTAMETLGLTVAKDVDIFAKEAMPFLTKFRPGILTQFEDAYAAGTFLAKAVLRRLESPDEPLMQHLSVPQLPRDWVAQTT